MVDEAPPRARVAVAGASGFVGRALLAALTPASDVVALTRAAEGRAAADGVTWRSCDLFNLRETERALEGCDRAVYLVHSMMKSARLSQGTFDDMDLVCADNFARAAATKKLSHIVYLGGIVPPPEGGPLSRHLESRLEVERTLAAHGVPVTTLRAGLVVGAGGSSFQMMSRLVERLPIMVAPRWTRSKSQAIALPDVVALLCYALAHPELAGRFYDVGCPDVVTYAEMLRLTGEALGKHTRIVTVPMATPKLSLLWVSLVAGAPRELVRPLVESLRHDMVAEHGLELQARAGVDALPLRAALALAVREQRKPALARATTKRPPAPAQPEDGRARSVQRLPLPEGRDAAWVAAEYARWLPRFLRPFLRVEVDATRTCRFYFWPLRWPLLVLSFSRERSAPDRQLFYVTGGLLAKTVEGARPRLEFRSVLDGAYVIAAVHDFAPRLPWLLYRFTQAIVHLLVMRGFGRHLAAMRALGPLHAP